MKCQCRGDAHGRKLAQALEARFVFGVEVEEADESFAAVSFGADTRALMEPSGRSATSFADPSASIARPSGAENLRRGMDSVPRSIDISASTSRRMRLPSASSASLRFSARSIPSAVSSLPALGAPPRKRL